MSADSTDRTDPTDRAGSWRRLALLLAGLLVVAVAGVVVLWLDRDGADGDPAASGTTSASEASAVELARAGTEAQTAAEAAVTRMTTYSWRTVDDDFGWVDEVGTEAFQSYFAGASAGVKQVVTATRATATGTVVDAAPRVVDATHVTVLLFVDQEIRSAQQKGAKIDQPRVSMDMLLVDGEWLVDEVQIGQLVG